jgi:hypothetical protein
LRKGPEGTLIQWLGLCLKQQPIADIRPGQERATLL